MIYGQSADEGPLNPWLIPFNGETATALGGKRAVIAQYSPTGNQVATVSWDNDLQIWDAVTGAALDVYPHDVEISALAYTPDGKQIIMANRTGEIVIRDCQTGKIEQVLHHDPGVNAVAVSTTNGKYLATADDNRTAALWRLEDGEKLLSLPHEDEVWNVEFGGDDRTLITGGRDGVLRIFDVSSGEQLKRMDFTHGISAIAYNAAADILAVGIRLSKHKQAWTDLMLIDNRTDNKIAQIELNGDLNISRFSPDGRLLATTDGNGDVKLRDTRNGALKTTLELQVRELFLPRTAAA